MKYGKLCCYADLGHGERRAQLWENVRSQRGLCPRFSSLVSQHLRCCSAFCLNPLLYISLMRLSLSSAWRAPAFPPVCLFVCLTASQNHFNLHSCLTRALGNDVYFKIQLLPLCQGPFWSLPFYTFLFNRCPLDLWCSNFEEWPVRYLWTSKHTESLRL